MARRQTRRAISVKGLTYQRLKKFCDANGVSVSGWLEQIIHNKLDALGAPQETILIPRTPKKKKAETEEIVSQHFTF